MNIYEVYYQSFEQRFMVLAPSVADVKEGFWVNKHNEFTKGSDCYKWIPPAQIVMVIKQEQYDQFEVPFITDVTIVNTPPAPIKDGDLGVLVDPNKEVGC